MLHPDIHSTSMDIWSFINRDVPNQTTFKKSTQNEISKISFSSYRRYEYSKRTCKLFFPKLRFLPNLFDIWLQKWLPNFRSQMQTLYGIWKLLSKVYAMRCACRLYTTLLQAFRLIIVTLGTDWALLPIWLWFEKLFCNGLQINVQNLHFTNLTYPSMLIALHSLFSRFSYGFISQYVKSTPDCRKATQAR